MRLIERSRENKDQYEDMASSYVADNKNLGNMDDIALGKIQINKDSVAGTKTATEESWL